VQADNEKHCSRKEMMIIAAAREIADKDVVYVGIGHPKEAAFLAKKSHAPNAIICIECGVIDMFNEKAPANIGDPNVAANCAKCTGMFYSLSLLQRGYADVGMIGGAEVDKYGNVNSTVIGPYKKPTIRFPGSGGACDFTSNARKTVILMPHEKRRFPEKVSFITSPGYIDGPEGRRNAGLKRGGPKRVITDLAVLGFHETNKLMMLESIHQGVTISEIENQTGFDLIVPKRILTTRLPSEKELKFLRSEIDPDGSLRCQ